MDVPMRVRGHPKRLLGAHMTILDKIREYADTACKYPEHRPVLAEVEHRCDDAIVPLSIVAITNQKDYGMIELWDDRRVQVEPNTGRRVDGRSA